MSLSQFPPSSLGWREYTTKRILANRIQYGLERFRRIYLPISLIFERIRILQIFFIVVPVQPTHQPVPPDGDHFQAQYHVPGLDIHQVVVQVEDVHVDPDRSPLAEYFTETHSTSPSLVPPRRRSRTAPLKILNYEVVVSKTVCLGERNIGTGAVSPLKESLHGLPFGAHIIESELAHKLHQIPFIPFAEVHFGGSC